MAFPPDFLDEVRQRVGLAETIGRQVRLQKRGHEYTGLCPFHNEKTPSFTVNEEKGFFHCFGCGAHGDVIGFVMQGENLPFRDAIERLAATAGLQMPQETAQDRERDKARATLLEVMETATVWFERQLRLPIGRAALGYLHGRGLDDTIIGRFRLGFAPPSRSGAQSLLKGALAREGVDETVLIEAGLVKRPEDGRASFDFFRDRVIFPISDRRGRVIAFGGRTLGDGQPKYLNSPETPLFQKGRTLYGLAQAHEAANRPNEILVTEGYTDVIALAQAGFEGALAPLGTAVTESQLSALWQLAPEPILCFDADDAGRRAAMRAAVRALPLLKPGKSLCFAELPAGEDPDSLIQRGGPAAMRAVLQRTEPLVDVIWRQVTAGARSDTPERRSALRKSLNEHAFAVADRTVQQEYVQEFRARLDHAFGPAARHSTGRGAAVDRRQPSRATSAGFPEGRGVHGRLAHDTLQQRILLAAAINHPALLLEYGEDLGVLSFPDGPLDNLRQAVINVIAAEPGLDADTLKRHLKGRGFAGLLEELWQDDIVRANFVRPDAPLAVAREGWKHILARLRLPAVRTEFHEAEQAMQSDLTDESQSRFRAVQEQLAAIEREADQADGVEPIGS